MSLLGLFDYPREICQLRDQIPQNERSSFLSTYKKLPNHAKADFKQALRNADSNAASQILGKDLTRYSFTPVKTSSKDVARATRPQANPGDGNQQTAVNDIVSRVNRILAVPTSADPELVAVAARRYEEAVPPINRSNSAVPNACSHGVRQ